MPLADFRAPVEPVYYDTTAGVIAACGLLEIAERVSDDEKHMYMDGAIKILEALETKWCDFDPLTDGILDGGSVSYHEKEHHQKIIYGDYFFTEAILRLSGKSFLIW